MLNKLIIILLFFAISHVNAQTESRKVVSIQYEKSIKMIGPLDESEYTERYISNYELLLFPIEKISLYDKIDKVSIRVDTVTTTTNSITLEYKPNGKNLNTTYKNYQTGDIYLKDMIGFDFIAIKDSLTIFNWDIKENTKVILGYSCQLATTSFRGRKYEAWFAIEIPQCGPWKFDGLPGAILSIKSLDDFISFEGTSIKIKMENVPIEQLENPFKANKIYTWSEFRKLYKEKSIAESKYKTQEGDELGSINPRRRIEWYIDQNDSDYTADKEFLKRMNGNK